MILKLAKMFDNMVPNYPFAIKMIFLESWQTSSLLPITISLYKVA